MRCDPTAGNMCDHEEYVSIPAGFSDALRPEVCKDKDKLLHVSIPAGFSDALRPIMHGAEMHLNQVSIPAGFSDALRLHLLSDMGISGHRFNPCWVF